MSIYKKLAAIQGSLNAPKNLRNTFGKYSYRSNEGILQALKPHLEEHNLSLTVSDKVISVGGRNYIEATTTLICCETGESVVCTAAAREPEVRKGMDDSQITGATSSYARKYCLNAMFAIDDNKDADDMVPPVKSLSVAALNSFVDRIKNAADMDQLKEIYIEAMQACAEVNDLDAREKIVAAKDAQKSIIEPDATDE